MGFAGELVPFCSSSSCWSSIAAWPTYLTHYSFPPSAHELSKSLVSVLCFRRISGKLWKMGSDDLNGHQRETGCLGRPERYEENNPIMPMRWSIGSDAELGRGNDVVEVAESGAL